MPIGADSLPRNFMVYQMRAVGDSLLFAATSIGLLKYSYRTDQLRIIPLRFDAVYCTARQVFPLCDSLMLVGYENNKGLYSYNINTQKLRALPGTMGDAFRTKCVFVILQGPGESVLVENRGRYFQYDYRRGTVHPFDRSAVPSRTKMYHSHKDTHDNLWFMTEEGVFVLPKGACTMQRITAIDQYCSPKLQLCRNIVKCNDSCVYACVDWQGVFVININTFAVQSVIRKDKVHLNELLSNSVGSIFASENNNLWICGDGLYLLQARANDAQFYSMREMYEEPPTKILSLCEDSYRNIWVGTDGSGLLRYNVKEQNFTSFFKTNSSSKTPASNVILSMLEDSALHRLWIGTYYAGLCWYDYRSRTFGNSPMDESKGILSNNVWTLAHDTAGNLLASFHCRSLARRNAVSGCWQNARVDNGGIVCDCIVRLFTDSQGRTWIGYSGCGLDLFNTASFAASNKVQRTPENVEAIIEDGSHLWVGILGGLRLFDKKRLQYVSSPLSKQLGEQKVNALLIDSKNRLWIAAENKLYVSNPEKTSLTLSSLSRYFDDMDIMAMIETHDGRLLFGGYAGLLFVPVSKAVEQQSANFSINISEIRLFKEPVTLSDIDGALSYDSLKTIELPYYNNYLGLSFSTLQLSLNDAVVYSCKLEGVDKQWQTLEDGCNRVEYTNLQTGDYVLTIKVSLKDNPSVFRCRSLHISIIPPLWKSLGVKIFVSVLLIASLVLSYTIRIRRMRRRQQQLEAAVEERTRELRSKNIEIAAQAETLEDQYLSLKEKQNELEQSNKELHRANATKNKLFSIVAHDLKSPFSGLYGLTHIMIEDFDKLPKEIIATYLNAFFESIVSIQTLLDSLLQWSRSQSDDIVLQPVTISLRQFIEDTCRPLEVSCRNKHIVLLLDTDVEVAVCADRNTFSVVLRNVVQNAIKFTPSGGMITVSTGIEQSLVKIQIRDSGAGIPPLVVEQIMNGGQFAESKQGTEGEMGTGLGLSICVDFMQRNNGEFHIEQQAGGGTCISLLVPRVLDEADGASNLPQTVMPSYEPVLDFSILHNKLILVVDDSEVIRKHLVSLLSPYATVLEASGGNEGIALAKEHLPDLILSDVVMPDGDGFDLCHTLVSLPDTAHIPVFLLTAKTTHIARIEGLQKGASDYITKPFNEQELLLKLCNALTIRKNLQNRIVEQLGQARSESNGVMIDPVLQRVYEVIEQNYMNPECNIELMYQELAMSRMTFYRKLKVLTNLSPTEMLSNYRLTKSKELIQQRRYTISEIAYMVGFNDPKYFSRKFKEFFGVSPSEVG